MDIVYEGGDVEVVTLSSDDEDPDVIGTGNAKDSSTKEGWSWAP